MRIHALILLLAVSTLCAQEPALSPQTPPAPAQAGAPAAQNETITIPAGTRIPLALSSPISSKSRPGDPVRAVTGFPVTVGKQLAIPVGTYVEGALDKVTKGGRSGPSLKMHFTRLDYVNGYSVDVEGANVQANAESPRQGSTQAAALAGPDNSYSSFAASTFPQPTLPSSHIGVAIGIGIAATAAGIAIPLILIHHGGGGGGVLFDSGWQFEMVLESSVTVDAANVAAAASHAP